jgi:hypothetical protein
MADIAIKMKFYGNKMGYAIPLNSETEGMDDINSIELFGALCFEKINQDTYYFGEFDQVTLFIWAI